MSLTRPSPPFVLLALALLLLLQVPGSMQVHIVNTGVANWAKRRVIFLENDRRVA